MKSSIIASEIISDWNFEKHLKSLYDAKRRLALKCRIDKNMQCDSCKLKDNCEDKRYKEE